MLKYALAALLMAPAMCSAASAQNTTASYARTFVSVCSTALLGAGEHKDRLKQAGFSRRTLKISRNAKLFAPKRPTSLCILGFGRVFPHPDTMMAAISTELSGLGYRDTGRVITVSNGGNPFGGTGALKRRVYSNGGQSITLETAGDGRNTAPVFGLQRLSP